MMTAIELQPHPLASIMPEMTEAEYDALVDSIARMGQVEPIIVYEGMIADGRHRYRACMDLGIEPLTCQWEQGEAELIDVVLAKNLYHRSLTSSQRAAVIVMLDEYITRQEEAARERQGDRTDLREYIPASYGRARDVVAHAGRTNPRYVDMAKKLHKDAPVFFEAVHSGATNILTAWAEFQEERGNEHTEYVTFGLLGSQAKVVRDAVLTYQKRHGGTQGAALAAICERYEMLELAR